MEREKLGSRLGFILISAGCAIGLGNVWRFPYITAKYGGGAFVLMYLIFLVIFGLPIMTMEFAVGRGSGKSIMNSFSTLEPKGTKWHWVGAIGIAGNYLLMMFYTVVSGWMFAYFFKMVRGDFVGKDTAAVSAQFGEMLGNPGLIIGLTLLVIALGFIVCALGLEKGVEKITKVMMILLLAIISIMAIRAITLPGAAEGLKYYLVPDFGKMKEAGIGEVIFAAMGQAFFTLSIGMGSMAIFGSYIKKDRRLFGESAVIAGLDTFVALMAGMIVIPSAFAFNLDVMFDEVGPGPGILFQVVPNIFNSLGGVWGRIWGTLFFLFMVFAAMSTVIAVFENIVSIGMDTFGLSRKKSCLVNVILVAVLAMPCALGLNIWSDVTILGLSIDGFEDFLISNNILPLGSLCYVLFCTSKKLGWGWDNFLNEANTGKGLSFPKWLYAYAKYLLPIIILVLWIWGNISLFA